MLRESSSVRWLLRLVACGYVVLLVLWPVTLVVKHTFADGFATLRTTLTDEAVVHALWLTAEVAGWAVAINLLFGVALSVLLVRHRFPGRRLLDALVDLPLSVSPVVVGLALILVYNGEDGWFGKTLEAHDVVVVFNSPGMILATCFVALPLVVREVAPVLAELGDDAEQAARSLGASGWQTLRRITLPAVKWAITYGVVLSLARSLGEYGAVRVVSGNITGETQTATLIVQEKYLEFAQQQAYATAFVLAAAAVACIVVVSLLRPKESAR